MSAFYLIVGMVVSIFGAFCVVALIIGGTCEAIWWAAKQMISGAQIAAALKKYRQHHCKNAPEPRNPIGF